MKSQTLFNEKSEKKSCLLSFDFAQRVLESKHLMQATEKNYMVSCTNTAGLGQPVHQPRSLCFTSDSSLFKYSEGS